MYADEPVLYLGGVINVNADPSLIIDRRIRVIPACLKRFGQALYDRTTVSLIALTTLEPQSRFGTKLLEI